MTEDLRGQDLKSSARRKLVRGAFGVPAVLALHSGSAIAASSAANCLVRQNLSPATGLPATADDGWFRYQLWVVRPYNGTPVSYWIKGHELDAFKAASGTRPFLSKSGRDWGWQEFYPSSNTVSATQIFTPPTFDSATQECVKKGPYIVLRVDGKGAIVGAGASGTGSAVGDSCWNSFALQSL